jgi:2-hydroxy-6-oxonona-2,4-dienedioate hydrolase
VTPLVMVHGFLGGSAQWAGQRDAIGNRQDIIAPDLPGFGANAAMTAPDRISAYAEYVLAELDAAGVETFDLLGHSMGGMIVQEIVAIAPQRVRKLVLYGTGAFSRVEGRFETYEESKRRAGAEGVRATARRIAATWFIDGERATGYEACAAIAEQASLQAILAGIDAFGNWSRVENLPNIRCPVLIIWGEHDRSYAWPQIEQFWRTIPGASLAVVPGCAHAVHLEKPQLFNMLIGDFLNSN